MADRGTPGRDAGVKVGGDATLGSRASGGAAGLEPLGEEHGILTTFRGSFQHALDEKGRVSFPATFRQALQESGAQTVVLTNFICDGARCLEGFSLESWREFEAKLRSRSRFDPQIRKLENFYLARAAECPLDGSGRIHVPPYLRNYAGLEREVVFTASLHGFRLWDKRVSDLVFQEAEQALLENPALFDKVDLEKGGV